MPVIAQETIVAFLMWSSGGLLVTLVAVLAWIAMGVIKGQHADRARNDANHALVIASLNDMKAATDKRYESLRTTSEAQFKQFGQQLASVHELVMQDIHKHDIRIVKLEEWRRLKEGDD